MDEVELIEEIKELADRATELLCEKDRLLLHECRSIEGEYVSKIGQLEYENFKLKCQLMWHRLAEEYYGEELKQEYEPYDDMMRQRGEDINLARVYSAGDPPGEKLLDDMDKIYKRIIRRAHPDLTFDQDPLKGEILFQALEAYENGELAELTKLEDALESMPVKEQKSYAASVLEGKKRRLEELNKELVTLIKKIKHSYPYNQKEFIEDDYLVKAQKENLMQIKAECESQLQNWGGRVH